MDTRADIFRSWLMRDSLINPLSEIADWLAAIEQRNRAVITQKSLDSQEFWYYDEQLGEIRNRDGSFFQISGLRIRQGADILHEQPIIIQNEIGYLGIIGRKIDGVLHFLMQAKIEPGNLRIVQLSPTIQATNSNFMLRHGGRRPLYIDYLVNSHRHQLLVDQLQSEQSSRFLGKRNRNIVILVDEDVPESPQHRWMTLGQIKELLRRDNLVNMDTRTVLSCLPLHGSIAANPGWFTDISMFRSLYDVEPPLWPRIFTPMNDFKMFDGLPRKALGATSTISRETVPLYELTRWEHCDDKFVCKDEADFEVIFCDIEIQGREVTKWFQPLFASLGPAEFGLFSRIRDGVREFLIRLSPEPGTFDKVEWGPTLQREYTQDPAELDQIGRQYLALLSEGHSVQFDVMLSEEGGRFYHEQNRNTVIELGTVDLGPLPEGYLWVDWRTLSELAQFNNYLNIQLRNLIALLEI